MKGDTLPQSNHVSRYCAPKSAPEGEPTGASFIMKPEEEYLSVNWLEYFGNIGRNAQIAQIREHINIKLAKSGLFAILNISDVVNLIKDKSLTVLHEPENGDPSHSGIHGYDHEDLMVAELMAQTVSGVYPARLS